MEFIKSFPNRRCWSPTPACGWLLLGRREKAKRHEVACRIVSGSGSTGGYDANPGQPRRVDQGMELCARIRFDCEGKELHTSGYWWRDQCSCRTWGWEILLALRLFGMRAVEWNELLNVLVATTQFVFHATHGLRAEDVSTEEADARVTEFLLGVRTATTVCFFNQAIEMLWQTDKLEDGRVRKTRPETMIFESDAWARSIPVEDPSRDNCVEWIVTAARRASWHEDIIKTRQMKSLCQSV